MKFHKHLRVLEESLPALLECDLSIKFPVLYQIE